MQDQYQLYAPVENMHASLADPDGTGLYKVSCRGVEWLMKKICRTISKKIITKYIEQGANWKNRNVVKWNIYNFNLLFKVDPPTCDINGWSPVACINSLYNNNKEAFICGK